MRKFNRAGVFMVFSGLKKRSIARRAIRRMYIDVAKKYVESGHKGLAGVKQVGHFNVNELYLELDRTYIFLGPCW